MATAAHLAPVRAALLACVAALCGLLVPVAATAAADPLAGARYVGEKRCGECHDTELPGPLLCLCLVPMVGLELTTFALRMRCSTN